MITLQEIDNNVFELKESIPGFSDTIVNLWYWDLDRKLLSERKDFPDSLQTRELTRADLDRFEKTYKPLIIKNKSAVT